MGKQSNFFNVYETQNLYLIISVVAGRSERCLCVVCWKFFVQILHGSPWGFLAVFMVIEYREVYGQRTVHLHDYFSALLEVQLCKFTFLSYLNYVHSKSGKIDRGRLCSFPIIACLCDYEFWGQKFARISTQLWFCDDSWQIADLSWSNKADVVTSLSWD